MKGCLAAVLCIAAALLGSGCSYVTPAPWVRLRSTAAERKALTTDPLDGVVRVATRDGECTGVLVDPKIVLTSHACLARIEKHDGMEFDFGALNAQVGGGVVPWKFSRVGAMIGSSQSVVVALVLVDPIDDAPYLPVRLGEPPILAEPVRAIGFGLCTDGGYKYSARAVGIEGIVTRLDDDALHTDAQICFGDSGGALVSSITGDVVGVVVDDPNQADVGEGAKPKVSAVQIARIDVIRELLARAWLYSKGAH